MTNTFTIRNDGDRLVTYQITKYSDKLDRQTQDEGVRRGLEMWEKETPLQFQKVDENPEFQIVFHKGHDYFKKTPNAAAAYFTEKVIMFNDDKYFGLEEKIEKKTNCFGFVQNLRILDMAPILAHEFGHFMGLDHTTDKNDIMYAPVCAKTPSSHDIKKMTARIRQQEYDVCDIRIPGFNVPIDKIRISGLGTLNVIYNRLRELETSQKVTLGPEEERAHDPYVYELHQIAEVMSMAYPEHRMFLQTVISLLYKVTNRNQIIKNPKNAPRPPFMEDEDNFYVTLKSFRELSSNKTNENADKQDFIRCCNLIWNQIDKIAEENRHFKQKVGVIQ